MFHATSNMENPGPSSSAENTSQKCLLELIKIREIVNDLDSDGSSFSEFSDSDTCTVEYILITRNKKLISDNHTHGRVMQVISAGSVEFGSDYLHPICSFCLNVSG
jgi:hypothetical protein